MKINLKDPANIFMGATAIILFVIWVVLTIISRPQQIQAQYQCREYNPQLVQASFHQRIKSIDRTYYFSSIEDYIIEYDTPENLEFLGYFELTFYCACRICVGRYFTYPPTTATMTRPTVGRTIAVAPAIIPFGTELYIYSFGYRIAEDTGGAMRQRARDVENGRHAQHLIDVYKGCHQTALSFGRIRNVRVYAVVDSEYCHKNPMECLPWCEYCGDYKLPTHWPFAIYEL